MKITGTITKIEHITVTCDGKSSDGVYIYIDLDDVSSKVLTPSNICVCLPKDVEIKEDSTSGSTLHTGDHVEVEFQMYILPIGTSKGVCANTNEICLWTIVKK